MANSNLINLAIVAAVVYLATRGTEPTAPDAPGERDLSVQSIPGARYAAASHHCLADLIERDGQNESPVVRSNAQVAAMIAAVEELNQNESVPGLGDELRNITSQISNPPGRPFDRGRVVVILRNAAEAATTFRTK